jgi:hypothetical protein
MGPAEDEHTDQGLSLYHLLSPSAHLSRDLAMSRKSSDDSLPPYPPPRMAPSSHMIICSFLPPAHMPDTVELRKARSDVDRDNMCMFIPDYRISRFLY